MRCRSSNPGLPTLPWIMLLLGLVVILVVPEVMGSRTTWSISSSRRRWNRELSGGCPKECECRDRGRKVDCTYRSLTYIPRGIARDVKRL